MPTVYFDLISGISGDMIISSLLSVGLPFSTWKREIARLKLPLAIKLRKVNRGHIQSSYLAISDKGRRVKTPKEFFTIIKNSPLRPLLKEKAEEILYRLLRAEAKVHGIKLGSIQQIHLHELGSYDTILDIIGSLLAIDILGIEKIYSSPVPLGKIRAPATLELLTNIPVYEKEIDFEITTPTGAAIISSLAAQFIPLPLMKIQRIGYGAGSFDLEIPNCLRAIIGEEIKKAKVIFAIETNIDNTSPELFEHIMERLFAQGALDVYLIPLYAKKNRPAVILSALVAEDKKEVIIDTIFEETKTLGIRIYPVERYEAEREIKGIKTEYGEVRVKIGKWRGAVKNVSFEYEDMKRIAQKKKIPLKILYDRLSRYLPLS